MIVDDGIEATIPNGLIIEGHAEVENVQSSSLTSLSTPWVLVTGHFRVGLPLNPYKNFFRISLTSPPRPLTVPHPDPRFHEYLTFGTGTFVILGGSVSIHAPHNGPVYTTLARTAVQGDSRASVSGDLRYAWNKNDVIGIAHTSMVWGAEDDAYFGTVTGVRFESDNNSIVFFEPHMQYMHAVRHVDINKPETLPYDLDMAPEVVKLNRRVVITGNHIHHQDAAKWYNSDATGASFIIAHSDLPQHVEGVEFFAMGQPGIWGSFPISVRFCGPDAKIVLKRNSIHHSKNRCVVITATDNVQIEENVSFRTAGHCFVVEDGLEKRNAFDSNVAIAVRPALQRISNMDISTENNPCAFWLAAPNNSLKNNVVGGARGGAYCYELYNRARGASGRLKLPQWDTYNPRTGPLMSFDRNQAHSTYCALKTHGLRSESMAVLSRLFAWTVAIGWQPGLSSNQMLAHSDILDSFYRGIDAPGVERVRIENSTISGELYNQRGCSQNSENTGISLEANHHFNSWSSSMGAIEIENVHFQDFLNVRNCKRNYAIATKIASVDRWFPSASYLSKITFSSVDDRLQVKFAQEHHLQFGLELKDDSIPGLGKGYLVSTGFESDNVAILGCVPERGLIKGLVFCKEQCWRHVSLAWSNPEQVSKIVLAPSNMTKALSFTPMVISRWVQNDVGRWRKYTRLVSALVPADDYHLQMIGAGGQPLPDSDLDHDSFLKISSDTRSGSPICSTEASIYVQNVPLPSK